MSNKTIATSTLESTLNNDEQKMEEILKAFSPLQLLSDAQRKELGTRFNKTWLKPRMEKVEALQKAHVIDFFTAAFTLGILEDADNMLVNRKIAKTADTMFNLSSELFGSQANIDAALLQIETAFDAVDTVNQSAVGKRFRQLVLKGNTSKMGVRILELVTEKLQVREAEWV